jgi:hypothetical protein
MKGPKSIIRSAVWLLMPLLLVLGGAGLAAMGLSHGSLVLMAMGAIVALSGVLWGVIMLDLANPFDLF